MTGILDGKVALITGAGSGIGRATAKIFAREAAQETLETVKQAGAKAICLKADVSQSTEVEAAVARTVAEFGRLDCAFNNAGIEGEPALTHKCSEANWNRVLSINLTGVWLCLKAEIAQLLKQGRGGAIV